MKQAPHEFFIRMLIKKVEKINLRIDCHFPIRSSTAIPILLEIREIGAGLPSEHALLAANQLHPVKRRPDPSPQTFSVICFA